MHTVAVLLYLSVLEFVFDSIKLDSAHACTGHALIAKPQLQHTVIRGRVLQLCIVRNASLSIDTSLSNECGHSK